MREFAFLFLYGMLTVTGIFLSVFWTRLTWCRLKLLERSERLQDRYLFLAGALGINSIGSVILFGGRLEGEVRHGLSPMLYGWEGFVIALGLSTILLAKVLMVWAADIEEDRRPRWLWAMGATAVFWTVGCLVLIGERI